MQLPDGSILMHAKEPYDPRKAHEYYLRTRNLKGRKRSFLEPTKGKQTRLGKRPSGRATYTINVGGGKTAKLTARQLKEQKIYAAERVTAIKKKLSRLNRELKDRIAEAKKAEMEANKPKSASEKAEAARESEKYRDKHKQELKNKGKKAAAKKEAQIETKPDRVEELKTSIKRVQKGLAAAVERQRSLSTATKNG